MLDPKREREREFLNLSTNLFQRQILLDVRRVCAIDASLTITLSEPRQRGGGVSLRRKEREGAPRVEKAYCSKNGFAMCRGGALPCGYVALSLKSCSTLRYTAIISS